MQQDFVFIAIVEIQIKKEKETEFKNWFNESNKELSMFDGFVNRRLLESSNGKNVVLVEFENKEKFEKMHQTQEHMRIQAKGHSMMELPPKPQFYQVISN